MKNMLLFGALIAGAFIFMNFQSISVKQESQPVNAPYDVPDDVQQLLDKSCVGCHNSDSRNFKARTKLSFDKLSGLRAIKQLSKLKDVAEMVEEHDMPPKKFLNNYPDANLTDDERKLVVEWARESAKKVSETID